MYIFNHPGNFAIWFLFIEVECFCTWGAKSIGNKTIFKWVLSTIQINFHSFLVSNLLKLSFICLDII